MAEVLSSQADDTMDGIVLVSDEEVRTATLAVLQTEDRESLTINRVRALVSEKLGCSAPAAIVKAVVVQFLADDDNDDEAETEAPADEPQSSDSAAAPEPLSAEQVLAAVKVMLASGESADRMTVRSVRERLVAQFGEAAAACDVRTAVSTAFEQTASDSDSDSSAAKRGSSSKPAAAAAGSSDSEHSSKELMSPARAKRGVRAKSIAGSTAIARAAMAKRRKQRITAADPSSDEGESSEPDDSDMERLLAPPSSSLKKSGKGSATKASKAKAKVASAKKAAKKSSSKSKESSRSSDAAAAAADSSKGAGSGEEEYGEEGSGSDPADDHEFDNNEFEDFGIGHVAKRKKQRKADKKAAREKRAAAAALKAKLKQLKPGDRTADDVVAEELAAVDEAAQARTEARIAQFEALRMTQDELRTVTAATHAS
eukprot:14913-Heterococcus_DN1.PRE.4